MEQQAFIDACGFGYFDKVKSLLLNENVNPADNNNYAIRWASFYGYYNIVKLLSKDKRVNPADWNNCAIRWVSENGYFNILKLLLGNKRVINSFNFDNIDFIKRYCSNKINDFYKKYFNLYNLKNIFLLINYICNTTINYKLPKQLKDFILHYYVYNYRKKL